MEYLRQLAMINVNPNRMPVSDAMLQRIREVLLNPGEPAVDQDRLLTDVTQAVIDLEARLADAVELAAGLTGTVRDLTDSTKHVTLIVERIAQHLDLA